MKPSAVRRIALLLGLLALATALVSIRAASCTGVREEGFGLERLRGVWKPDFAGDSRWMIGGPELPGSPSPWLLRMRIEPHELIATYLIPGRDVRVGERSLHARVRVSEGLIEFLDSPIEIRYEIDEEGDVLRLWAPAKAMGGRIEHAWLRFRRQPDEG